MRSQTQTTNQRGISFFLGLVFLPRIIESSSFFAPSSCSPRKSAFIIASTYKLESLPFQPRPNKTCRYIKAPPGSGYVSSHDEIPSEMPVEYEPQMAYPGTMRPGKSPENQSYLSLPIGDDDPDPVPWPHFQEIEWHHNWGSPHDHPIPMEEFIDMHGRWATVEMEAEVRKGARRGVRERKELEEAQKSASFILDDDDDDDDEVSSVSSSIAELGDDSEVDVVIGSEVGSVDSGNAAANTEVSEAVGGDGNLEEDDDDSDENGDFLIDLGLDVDDDDNALNLQVKSAINPMQNVMDEDDDEDESVLNAIQNLMDVEDEEESSNLNALQNFIDVDDEGVGSNIEVENETETDLNLDDLGLDFTEEETAVEEKNDDFAINMMGGGGNDTNEVEDDQIIPLDDMIGDEDLGDDDAFDDGGFDYN